MELFLGNRAILSGPAGGVVGYAMTSYFQGGSPVIGFDMGGTSTDVSRFAGAYEHVFESVTAGVTVCSPQLDINTVAAGGGSRLYFRNGLFVVGPESAGSHPGPVCYRKGGYLAVTDANLLLGRLQPHIFPAIFGPHENEQLDLHGASTSFHTLAQDINSNLSRIRKDPYTLDEIAYSFITVANEAMARPIRNLTTMKGYDVTEHALACFGGAGPQHCCAIAKSLGMKKIFVHRYSGVLSAYGLSLADVVVEQQEPFSGSIYGQDMDIIKERFRLLEAKTTEQLVSQGFESKSIYFLHYLAMRYMGTDTSLMISLDTENIHLQQHSDEGESESTDDNSPKNIPIEDLSASLFEEAFKAAYRREFGFELLDRQLVVDDIRIRAVGSSKNKLIHTFNKTSQLLTPSATPIPKETVLVYFPGGRRDTPVYHMDDLQPGVRISGPALIIQNVATVVLELECECLVTTTGDLEISVPSSNKRDQNDNPNEVPLDSLMLSLFSHRFMGIAEQMGRTLQRTSVSVNIKERLDFSCALFDGDGGLVANAPHLPVHLGAMSDAVRYQIRHWGGDLHDGDVLVSNHPQLAGGSHLPDITVMTPVFRDGKIVFFVASRGHHADVGGISPGSMPPLSKSLSQEGAAIVAFKIVKNGVFQEEDISQILLNPGSEPECSGTRLLADNLSDLKAQVAANTKGVALMQELVDAYGLGTVTAYMKYIQQSAEAAVRDMLRNFASNVKKQSTSKVEMNLDHQNKVVVVNAQDFLDDGTPLCLEVTVDSDKGSAIFDFEGTGCEVLGNLNAPPAVTASAVIYCMRCLLGDLDIPLNQGCLVPINIRIPEQCLLRPSATAAVVGGNVLTSQRVTDVILKAFSACAASQGCMNNLTFGDDTFGYYETIAGGAGAGPTWHGASGVHTHMTNTRITDPEILERRYPVLLRQFALRRGSGGVGRFKGGDGVIRELEFLRPLTVSILSERRAFQPYGMAGGGFGARGVNILHMKGTGRVVNIGGKNSVLVAPHDRLILYTPGGGGYGGVESVAEGKHQNDHDFGVNLSDEDRNGAVPVRSGGSLGQYSMMQETA